MIYMSIQLFGKSVSSLDRETHHLQKNGTTNLLKSEPLSIEYLRDKFDINYNIEITLTLRPKVRKEGVLVANKHLINIISKQLKAYAGKNKFYYYLNIEKHKPYNDKAFYHSHGIISFYCIHTYADFLRKVAAMDKWFYRNNIKSTWSRIISLNVKYPIKEGNVDRKIGSFKNWYNYIHDEKKQGTLIKDLGFATNIGEKKKKNFTVFYDTYLEQKMIDGFFPSESSSEEDA